MTDINRLLNTTLAGQIARKLDESDGTADNKIEASVWNKFINDIGTGKTVKENISIGNAMKSITTYVVKLAAQAGKAADELAAEWLSSVGGAPQGVEKPEDADDSKEKEGAKETGKKSKGTAGKYSADDTKVTVPVKYISPEAKAVIEAHKQGAKLHDALKKGDTINLTKENVASAFTSDINFGPNTKKQAETVFTFITNRMSDLGIFEVGKDYGLYSAFSKLSYAKQNQILHTYRNRIIVAENNIVKNAQAEKDQWNSNRAKIQSQIDKSNSILVEVANNPKQAKIERGTNSGGVRWATATLKTGEWIKVWYDKNGEIDEITISHDTTPDKTDDEEFDGAEVQYEKDKAWVSTEHNGSYDYNIDGSNYNFSKLKELAEAIFGKAQ